MTYSYEQYQREYRDMITSKVAEHDQIELTSEEEVIFDGMVKPLEARA